MTTPQGGDLRAQAARDTGSMEVTLDMALKQIKTYLTRPEDGLEGESA